LGYTDDTGSQGRRFVAGECENQFTPWQASVAIHCSDDRYRRVPANEAGELEPSLFALAHGVPNRVGTLRGSGNAINPWLTAEFIKASFEAIG
jgi:DNA (cytosine-5)-methyltransferase 1